MATMDGRPATVGEALGHKHGDCEFKELKKIGGIKKIKARLPDGLSSNDNILATAEGKEGEGLLHEIPAQNGRAPGGSTVNGVSQLKPGQEGGYRVPYNPSTPATVEHYKAAMLLSGVGDALGYKHGDWEFNFSGPDIHKELKKIGGIKKIKARLPDWPLSDDTILHLATAEGLATGKEGEALLHEIAALYKKGMTDMNGRAPGGSTVNGVSQLKPGQEGGYRVPYNPRSGGCGAAMRAMCIGLRYPHPEQLKTLVEVAVETGRMTHTLPAGFLGAVAAALFTAYTVQRRPMTSWGTGLLDEACPIAKSFVKEQGYAVEETLRDWDYFSKKWQSYLDLRGLSNGVGPVIWPDAYGVAERDEAYKSFSFRGWGGSSGHDAPMIALDALLAAGSDWEELMNRAAFHGGDSDSTAVIACCCWGVLYGTKGVPEGNYAKLEYRDRLEKCAEQLYTLSHSQCGCN